jgi:uncharacterized lipoprotein YddW (UPF0748 family)
MPVLLLAALFLTTAVLQAQEFRGAWVASVWNLNFPTKASASATEQRAEITQIVAAARKAGLNQLLVQVRPESCALYPSSLEPWSRFLTGKQGRGPGFDPLAAFIEEGKKSGIKIHAWFNPYRAAVNASLQRDPRHITNRMPEFTHRVGNMLVMDPGAPAVRAHIIAVVRDVLRRYDVDGIHIDDYFYPYPPAGKKIEFPDDSTYLAYRKAGGRLSRADWRRDNVNRLVRELHTMIKTEKPGVLFGVSPFGIYTKGQPADVEAGLDQYNEIFADPVKWLREGWVDYIAPQLYWKDGGPQSFSSLLKWWRSPSVNPRGIPVYPGIALDRLTSPNNWPIGEIERQLRAERTIGPRGRGGFILYNVGQVVNNTKGVRTLLANIR